MSDGNTVADLNGVVGSERDEAELSIQVMVNTNDNGDFILYVDHQNGDQLLVAEIYLNPTQASKLAGLLDGSR